MTSRKLRSRIVMENISKYDSSIQSSPSSDFLRNQASSSAPPRNGCSGLQQSSNSTRRARKDSPTVVVQLEEILTCDAPNCNYHTSFKVNLERHKKIMHELKRLKCPDCGFVTHSEAALNRHSITHDSKVSFKCQLCPWTTTVGFLLTQHIERHERAKLREQGISRASEFGKRFKCSKCDFRAVSKKEVHNHNYSHETERKYKCTFPGCDYRSKTAPSLKEHVKRHDLAANKEFQCQLCFKVFWTKSLLTTHIQSHTKERTVHCPKCKYVTNFPSGLTKHMLTHDRKSYQAADKQNAGEFLGVFDNERSSENPETANSRLQPRRKQQKRQKSIEMATEATDETAPVRKKPKKLLEKKHKCDQCDFRAINKPKIFRHAVVHRNPDDKIYSCSFPGCGFKTNWDDYVKKHYRDFHKSTPDLACPVQGCGFQTKWKDTLVVHKKKIHERRKRNYQCPMCRKAFYDSTRLKEHINIHTRENKYKCSLCDYVSSWTSNVKSHGRRHHGGQEFEPVKLI